MSKQEEAELDFSFIRPSVRSSFNKSYSKTTTTTTTAIEEKCSKRFSCDDDEDDNQAATATTTTTAAAYSSSLLFLKKMGHSRPLFFLYFRLFNTQLTVNNSSIYK